MSVVFEDNEIVIRHFIFKKKIPYSELKNVNMATDKYTITTKAGEVYKEKRKSYFFEKVDNLYDAIGKYSVGFRNELEASSLDRAYSYDEIERMIPKIIDQVTAVMNGPIKEKYGDAYALKILMDDSSGFITLCLKLTKDGRDVEELGVFDDITIAYLVEWDGSSNCGIYGAMNETEDQALMEKEAKSCLEHLFRSGDLQI